MKNECLRLFGTDKPIAQHHKPLQEQETHIVLETVDGRVVETRLPKEQAQRLFRKIRSAGGEVTIKEYIEKLKEDSIAKFGCSSFFYGTEDFSGSDY